MEVHRDECNIESTTAFENQLPTFEDNIDVNRNKSKY